MQLEHMAKKTHGRENEAEAAHNMRDTVCKHSASELQNGDAIQFPGR